MYLQKNIKVELVSLGTINKVIRMKEAVISRLERNEINSYQECHPLHLVTQGKTQSRGARGR